MPGERPIHGGRGSMQLAGRRLRRGVAPRGSVARVSCCAYLATVALPLRQALKERDGGRSIAPEVLLRPVEEPLSEPLRGLERGASSISSPHALVEGRVRPPH